MGRTDRAKTQAVNYGPGSLLKVGYWHIASFAALHHFWSLTPQSGQWPESALNWSVANDPKQEFERYSRLTFRNTAACFVPESPSAGLLLAPERPLLTRSGYRM
jgi:hypothetical protein